MNLKILFALALSIITLSLNAQQSGGAGGAGGNAQVAPTIAPTKPTGSAGGGGVNVSAPSTATIILDRLEVVVEKLGTWITLFGTFPAAPTGITISRDGEWVSFQQNWSVENGIKFEVDSSLPSGTYEVFITQGDNRNKQSLSFSITETGEVSPVPTVGGKILLEPNNDRRPVINSFEPKLIAGQRTIITGEGFTPPVMVRIEGNSGDVAWARRVVPTSEGILEFVTPGTHFGSLMLVVDNGHGTYRGSVTVVSPPPLEPDVLDVSFVEIGGGKIAGFVQLSKPLSPTSILVLADNGKPGDERPREITALIVLYPPNPVSPSPWNEEIAESVAKGIAILTPPPGLTLYAGNTVVFIVPELFASKGVQWLNAKERDPEGRIDWAQVWGEVEDVR